jgi:nitrogen fixation protein NifZ
MKADADTVELDFAPVFTPGDKVRAKTLIRNDGGYMGKRVGDLLIEAGEVGYVRAIGTFLQRYYIYEVDFLEKRLVIGMRAKELDLLEAAR